MPTLRTFLLALLLPVLVLPDGIVVCLHRLVGDTAPQSCCNCCGRANENSTPPPLEIRNDDCVNCCLALPATERSIDSTAKKSADASLASTSAVIVAPPCPIAPAPRTSSRAFTRAPTSAPPPLVLLALPLRL